MGGKAFAYTSKPKGKKTLPCTSVGTTCLSAFFVPAPHSNHVQRFDVTDNDIQTSLKRAAELLNYHK